MNLVSIIVPVFNTEAFLEDCIDSLLNQTYHDIEIILIDNGSMDSSYQICLDYEQRYSNIRSFKYTEKHGPGATRNYGLSKAHGSVIGFCDSDDRFSSVMVEQMMAAIQEKSDFVIVDMYSERIGSNLGLPWKDGTSITNDDIRNSFVPFYLGNESDNDTTIPVWGSVVRCLFLRRVIVDYNIKFPENITFAEDLMFTLQYLTYAKRVYIINKPYYYYRYNDKSLMNSYISYKEDMWETRLQLINTIIYYMKEMGIYEKYINRFNCSIRAYVHECVGNASKNNSFFGSYLEVRTILSSKCSVEAFRNYDAKTLKKRILYTLMKNKMSLCLLVYYKLRNAK